MVRLKVRKRLGLTVATVLLLGLVATGMGQDWASILAPAKGKKCQVYLKSGEVRKGKLIKVGEDYITLDVKLSPFYAEPQTYRITQVERIEYGNRAVDVDQLLASGGKSQQPSAAGAEPTPAAGTSSSRASVVSRPTTARSGSESDDDTVQKLMAILKSLDEGPTSKPEQGSLAAATEPATSTGVGTDSRVAEQSSVQARSETSVRQRVQPASRPERARKVVVPLTRKTVQPRPVGSATKPASKPKSTSKAVSVPRQAESKTVRARRPRTVSRKRTTARKPQPRKTIPAPKPPKSKLAQAPAPVSKPVGDGQAPKVRTQEAVAALQKPEVERTQLVGAGAASSTVHVSATEQTGQPVLKAVTVLAGAVGLLALAVLALTVVVLKRHKASAPQPVASVAPSVPVAAEEPAPSPEPTPKPPAPIHVVMVKGDYAVVDRGLDQGIKVGELLLLRRSVEDGEYEIGLARVLKVFDRLSGVKLIERWVETDLRVGDSAVRYRPAEPAPEELASVAVTHVGGRPHPSSKPSEEVQQMRLPSETSSQRHNGWST